MKDNISGSMVNELEVAERLHNDRLRAIENLRKLKAKEHQAIKNIKKTPFGVFTECKIIMKQDINAI